MYFHLFLTHHLNTSFIISVRFGIGAGKTTLLETLAGQFKPYIGDVLLNGTLIEHTQAEVSLVQSVDLHLPLLNVLETLKVKICQQDGLLLLFLLLLLQNILGFAHQTWIFTGKMWFSWKKMALPSASHSHLISHCLSYYEMNAIACMLNSFKKLIWWNVLHLQKLWGLWNLQMKKHCFWNILRIWLTTRILKYILPDGAQTGHIGWQDYSLSHKQPLSN